MSLLALALVAAPQIAVPGPPLSGAPLPHGPTTWVRTGAAASSGSCSPLSNGGFHNGLYAWDTAASTAAGTPGEIAVSGGTCSLAENESFLTTLSQGLCVPADTVALTFDLVAADFDTSGGFVPDAFEVSLLDGAFQSVVPTWSSAATSFFNVQEDGTMLMPTGVTATGGGGVLAHVRLDLAGLAGGLASRDDLTLYFDLIGADGDHTGSVLVDNVILESSNPGTSFCEGISCPCGNDVPGRGCRNSSGLGGLLVASGSSSIAADDLTLRATGLTLNFSCLILAQSEACTRIGDGYLAVDPGLYQQGLLRGEVQLVAPDGSVTFGPGVVSIVEGNLGSPGLVTAGSTWFFQVAYRDEPTSPCGTRFNLTNGLRVTFGG